MTEKQLKLMTFFKWVWQFRPIFCECGCGTRLSKKFSTAMMDHTLEKSKYPECMFSKTNIKFYTLNCHANKTNGFPNELQEKYIEECYKDYKNLIEESSIFENKLNKLIFK